MGKGTKCIRTRYAPSPTGLMHVGNLRTALYEYLIAKSQNGKFILRIEDTDQDRLVEGAIDVIYKTLDQVGLKHDEGPDVGGDYGPYVQSERKDIYLPFAEKLIKEGKAYYCFCTKERLEEIKETDAFFAGYDRHCRELSQEEVDKLLEAGTPYVIRQKMPLEGETTFHDQVFGSITTPNNELADQILIKTDGYPTYNFANVIDDSLMNITHVVRGSEYLSSTPKYVLLYQALGLEEPEYVHLPLIMGKNEDGSVSKLSKRHGSTSFEDLIKEGYLPEAIINYIAMLGWCPKTKLEEETGSSRDMNLENSLIACARKKTQGVNQEVFSLDELAKEFSIDGISKSPAVFDYDKLNWFNSEYIKSKSIEEFERLATPYFESAIQNKEIDFTKLATILHQRVVRLTDIPSMIGFFGELPDYNVELFINKKSKTNLENSKEMLSLVISALESLECWDSTSIHDTLIDLAKKLEVKNGTVMWPTRIAASGTSVTPGGAIEILDILGKEESIKRLKIGLDKLENEENEND